MTTGVDKTDDVVVPARLKAKPPSPKNFFRAERTEPVMAFYCMAFYLPITFVQNLMMDKVCDESYGRDHCRLANGNLSHVEEDHVQQVASQQLLYYNLMQQVPALVLTLLLGHWSDLHGRRAGLLLPALGNITSNVLYTAVYLNDAWPSHSIVWAALPAGLSGGYPVFMMSFFGWLRDIHSLKELALRIAINDGIEAVSIQLACVIGGQLFAHFGYIAVFGTAAGCGAIAAILIVTNVKDERYPTVGWPIMARDLVQIGTLVESFKMLAAKRRHRKRCYLLLMCVITFIGYIVSGGGEEIAFLYTRLRVHWNAVNYSYYAVAQAAFVTLGCVLVAPVVTKVFRLEDMTVAFLGHFGYIGFYLTTAFARTTLTMFAASSFLMFGSLTYITFRAVITKCISSDEAGKLMAVSALIQTVGSNAGSTVATRIYVATLATSYPWTCYLVFTALLSFNILVFCWMTLDMKRHKVDLDFEEDDKHNAPAPVSQIDSDAVSQSLPSNTLHIC